MTSISAGCGLGMWWDFFLHGIYSHKNLIYWKLSPFYRQENWDSIKVTHPMSHKWNFYPYWQVTMPITWLSRKGTNCRKEREKKWWSKESPNSVM